MQRIKYYSERYRTPASVQKLLRSLAYNDEKKKETLRSAESALSCGAAHCFEAALAAAAVLERHGFPPLLLSLDSVDDLDHVLFVYKQNGRWGSVARSRDEGLHGRPPIYKSLRALAWSYFDAYIDKTGRLQGFCLFNLDDSGLDWRASKKNVWGIDGYRMSLKHLKIISSERRYRRVHNRYLKYGPMPRQTFWR